MRRQPYPPCFKTQSCPPATFQAPILNMGTDLKDKDVMPNLISLPLPPFLDCLWNAHVTLGGHVCALFRPRDPADRGWGCHALTPALPGVTRGCCSHSRVSLDWLRAPFTGCHQLNVFWLSLTPALPGVSRLATCTIYRLSSVEPCFKAAK